MADIKIRVSTHDNDTKEVAFNLKGASLELTLGADKATVDLSELVPASKADRFLADVQYDKATKEMVFTTKAENEQDQAFRLPLADLLETLSLKISNAQGNAIEEKEDGFYVAAMRGEQGPQGLPGADGQSAYEIWIAEGNTGSKEDFLESLKGEAGGKLDLSTIPEKAFEQGSTILAKDKKGNLYQFSQTENVLTDVGVTLSASGATEVTGGTAYTITAKIANASNTDTGEVQAVIYTHSDLHNVQMPDGVTLADKTFTIANLAAYETKTVTFDVLITANQYVSATVSTVGDMVSSNNTASLNLSAAAISTSTNNTFTTECPVIKAVMVGYENETLSPSAQVAGATPGVGSLDYNLLPVGKLGGVQLKLDGASSVVVKADDLRSYIGEQNFAVLKETGELAYEVYGLWSSPQHRTEVEPAYYTYDAETGLLTFAENYPYPYATIIARPGNVDCKWQVFNVWGVKGTSAYTVSAAQIEVLGLDQKYYEYQTGSIQFSSGWSGTQELTLVSAMANAVVAHPKLKLIGDNIADYVYLQDWEGHAAKYVQGGEVTTSSFLAISLTSGSAYEFTLKAPYSLSLPETQGNIAMTNIGNNTYKVVVSANATATDDIYRDKLRITIA